MLITLTILSLATAATLAVITGRTLTEERKRSAARVAALAAMLPEEETSTTSGESSRAVKVASLFGTKAGDAVRGTPVLRAAVVAALGLSFVVIAAVASRHPVAARAATIAPMLWWAGATSSLTKCTCSISRASRSSRGVSSGASPAFWTKMGTPTTASMAA